MTKVNIGDIYGDYEVLNRNYIAHPNADAAYWDVKCIHCGLSKTIRSDTLKKYNRCKCQTDQMLGKTIGELEVLKITDTNNKAKYRTYICRCINCGHLQIVTSDKLRSYPYCEHCHMRKTTMIDMTGETFGYLTVLERDLSPSHTGHEEDAYWICKCNKCGTIKSIRGISLRNGVTKSCGCIKSYGEEQIATILTDNNILFEREYSFDDLVYKNKLRFDFAIFKPDGKLSHLIEYDGSQHFSPRNSGWNTQENYEQTIIRDNIKNEYCKENNIKLIRIKFDEPITLEKILGGDINAVKQ